VGIDLEKDILWMQRALSLAQRARASEEVPVGAVLIKENELLGEGANCPITTCDPTAHAEVQAIRAASKVLSNYRLNNTTLYITLEPCAMCAGAIIQARIQRVVFGASDPKSGAAGSVFNILQSEYVNHRPILSKGILAKECAHLLTSFFQEKRDARTG